MVEMRDATNQNQRFQLAEVNGAPSICDTVAGLVAPFLEAEHANIALKGFIEGYINPEHFDWFPLTETNQPQLALCENPS